jgi:hypothetical protein
MPTTLLNLGDRTTHAPRQTRCLWPRLLGMHRAFQINPRHSSAIRFGPPSQVESAAGLAAAREEEVLVKCISHPRRVEDKIAQYAQTPSCGIRTRRDAQCAADRLCGVTTQL